MKEFLRFLWKRYIQGCRNLEWGRCRWNCGVHPKERLKNRIILIDEQMCWPCYEDYCARFK